MVYTAKSDSTNSADFACLNQRRERQDDHIFRKQSEELSVYSVTIGEQCLLFPSQTYRRAALHVYTNRVTRLYV